MSQAFEDTIQKMTRYNWEGMAFKERQELIEDFVQEVLLDYGPNGLVAPLGYDVDDAQMIVWRAYEKALETGKVRLGVL